jgi:hypothetical protein
LTTSQSINQSINNKQSNSPINKISTLPPIGLSDHAIVYVEADIWLKRIRETHRKIFIYNKANWDNIKADLDIVHSDILKTNNTADIDST